MYRSVRTIEKGLNILELISKKGEGAGITEIAKALGLYKSVVHRIVTTLLNRGYLTKLNDKYKLGNKILEIAGSLINKTDISTVAGQFIKDLVDKAKETVQIAVLDGNSVLYIAKEECDRSIRLVSKIGSRLLPYCTGLGKVLLAYLNEEKLNNLLNNIKLKKFTENTITNKTKLKKELTLIKKRGYAIDNGEFDINVRCVACPIFNYNGEVIAAISIAGPYYRMNMKKRKEFIPIVKDSAMKISKSL